MKQIAMKQNNLLVVTAALVAVMGVTGVAGAQQGGGPGGPGGGRGNRPNFQDMTPEQQQQWMQQMQQQQQQQREQQIRDTLANAGFTAPGIQGAVIDFANAQDARRQALRQQAQQVAQASQDANVKEADLAKLVSDFRAVVAKEKADTTAALQELEGDIEYSKNPRLDAILLTLGITGDEMSLAGMGGGRGGRGGFGGPGGPGGRGGQGGGQGGRGA